MTVVSKSRKPVVSPPKAGVVPVVKVDVVPPGLSLRDRRHWPL